VTVAGAIIGASLFGAQGAALALAAGAVASVGIWSFIVTRMTRKEGEMDQYFQQNNRNTQFVNGT
jgi:outer membrane lipoprotein SlyB